MSWENDFEENNNKKENDSYDSNLFNMNDDNNEEDENLYHDILDKNQELDEKIKPYNKPDMVTSIFFPDKKFDYNVFKAKSEKEKYEIYKEKYNEKMKKKNNGNFNKIFFHPDLLKSDSDILLGDIYKDNRQYQINSFLIISMMMFVYVKKAYFQKNTPSHFGKAFLTFFVPVYCTSKYMRYRKIQKLDNLIDNNSTFRKYLYTGNDNENVDILDRY